MKKSKYLLFMAVALGAISCTKDPAVGGREPQDVPGVDAVDAGVVAGWVRVKLKEDAGQLATGVFTRGEANTGNEELDRIASALGATEVERVFSDGGKFEARHRRHGLHLWYNIRFDESVPVTRAAADLADASFVDIVEPIYEIRTQEYGSMPADAVFLPTAVNPAAVEMPFNDPMLPEQWHYHNDGSLGGGFSPGADINLFEAWKIEKGRPEVIVSVHDEGVDINHEDLAAHIWVNEAELNGEPGKDNDNNGKVGDIYGWNFISGSANIIAADHGSHVSGTISAVNGNGIGVGGVAGGKGPDDGVRIMCCQIIPTGGTTSKNGPDSYIYAADNGSVISQNSWTMGSVGELPSVYADAFDYYIANAGMGDSDGDGINDVQTGPMAGGIIIFAAGNAGGETMQPARSDKVIAVTAMGPNYMRGSYASSCEHTDIMAPGGGDTFDSTGSQYNVLSTIANNRYAYYWGTSMAAPHVSGVAALIVSHFAGEGFTGAECRKRLLAAYKPMGGLVSNADLGRIGVGLVDAALGLVEEPETAPAAIGNDASASATDNMVTLGWKVPADGNGLAVGYYEMNITGVSRIPGREDIVETMKVVNHYRVGDEISVSYEGLYETDYTFEIWTVDRYGNRSESAVKLSATTGHFDNIAPTTRLKFEDLSFPTSGDENAKEYRLSTYFNDKNLSMGDVLTFVATSSQPDAVRAEIVGGNTLRVVPLAKGVSEITVTATDYAGKSVSQTFTATVVSGTGPVTPTPGKDGMTLDVPEVVSGHLLNMKLSGAEGISEVSVEIFDSAARKVFSGERGVSGSGTVDVYVHDLAPGVYSVTVTAGDVKLVSKFLRQRILK